jgi:formylglycine-generating enzyme required for sulfatase activity
MWDGQDEKTGRRILRGEGWDSTPEASRGSHRRDINPINPHVDYGFRLVRRAGH